MPIVRSLRRVPLLSTAVVITFAVATAIAAIVFSLVWHILLRQMPFPGAERLVFVWNRYGATEAQSFALSPPDFDDYRNARSFESAAAWMPASVNLTDGEPRRLSATKVTPRFFDVLQVRPALGTIDEEGIVLSDAAWRAHFGARRDIAGATVRIDGVATRVSGVMPPAFAFPDPETEVWIPLVLTATDFADANRGSEYLYMVARLRNGVSLPQAQAEVRQITTSVFHRVPDRVAFLKESRWHVAVFPLRDDLVRRARPALLVLLGASLLVTLLAAANVMGLFLARATARQKELMVRVALGARQWRIIRTIASEVMLLAACGVVVGLLLARLAMPHVALSGLPRAHEVRVDAVSSAVATALVLGMATLISLGVAAWARASNTSATRLRATLVATQVAIAITLLISGAMLLQTYSRLRSVELGFEPQNVLTFAVELPRTKYESREQRQAFFLELQERLRAMPGVASASAVSNLPFSPIDWTSTFRLEGVESRGKDPFAHVRAVMPGYTETLRIPILRGRAFTEQDRDGTPLVCIIDDTAARRYWPGQDPVGKRIEWGDTFREVVGVVGSIHTTNLFDEAPPHLYMPLLQRRESMMYGVVRVAGDPGPVARALPALVRAIDPAQPVYAVQPLDRYLQDAVAQPRLRATVVAASAAVAILLALTGLYALLAFVVATRTREVGLRIALGATPAHVVRFVVRWALRITATGIVFGIAGAFAMTRSMRALLFGVDPLDPLTYAGVIASFAIVALLAGVIPAIRASRIDPAVALKAE